MMNIHEIISLYNLLYIFYNYTVYGLPTIEIWDYSDFCRIISDYSSNTPGVLPHLHACKHVKSVLTHMQCCGANPAHAQLSIHCCTLTTQLHISDQSHTHSWTADEKEEWKSSFTRQHWILTSLLSSTFTFVSYKMYLQVIWTHKWTEVKRFTLISEAFSNMACLEDNSAWEMEKSPSRAFWARTLAICRSYSICEQTSTHVNHTGHWSTASTASTLQQQHLRPLVR